MSTTSDIWTLIFCSLYMGSSIITLATHRGCRATAAETDGPPARWDVRVRDALREVLQCTLLFRLLFFPAVLITLFLTVGYLLAPTVSDAVPAALAAALTLHLGVARYCSRERQQTLDMELFFAEFDDKAYAVAQCEQPIRELVEKVSSYNGRLGRVVKRRLPVAQLSGELSREEGEESVVLWRCPLCHSVHKENVRFNPAGPQLTSCSEHETGMYVLVHWNPVDELSCLD